MKVSTICILLALIIGTGSVSGQLPLTNKAAGQCQSKEYTAAEETIARALQAEEEKYHPYAWYVSGFIQKEIFKESESGIRNSTHRTKAVSDLEKALTLDAKREYSAMILSAMRYLATTYLNDAILMTREITSGNDRQPEIVYGEFERIMGIADPAADLKPYALELHRKLAQAHYLLWEKDVSQNYHFEQSTDYYTRVLASNPGDCEANYNLAILYYNYGVHKIRKIGSTTDVMDLILIQDECVKLFRQSLPYAESTLTGCGPRLDYYKAMMLINRAMGNEDAYDAYKALSEEMIRNGKLKK
jgi:tetratricopeptide (TPR) repeat protein